MNHTEAVIGGCFGFRMFAKKQLAVILIISAAEELVKSSLYDTYVVYRITGRVHWLSV